jgi:hypothetical protein
VHMVFLTVSKSRPEIIIRKKLPMPLPIECYVEEGSVKGFRELSWLYMVGAP